MSDIQFETDIKSRTNYTIFVCQTPYLPGPEVVSIEILTDNGVFSSSINNQFTFLEPPIVQGVSPHIAPLGVDNLAFIIKGGIFDPAYEYFC